MVKVYKVIWSKSASKQLKEACQYILKNSLQDAQKVKSDILSKAQSLKEHPSRYAADSLRVDKDPKFRATELHHYRISYYIDEDSEEVIILRVRHSSQAPLQY